MKKLVPSELTRIAINAKKTMNL